ncbi:MAG: efflux RND transporter periplasmic adaptor subunit [Synergistaceae bacterium]|jgi:RND family efflux transporter MFP subunit|nr:efflux RND transporter periplasmic adaptor subunit [Synergistaceae bacterium]
MKLFFSAAMAVIIAISASFIGYGVYLNRVSDSHIETMMASRAVVVHGFKVSYSEITPEIVLDNVTLQAGHATDVIAQIDGSVSEMFVSQGQHVKRGQKICALANMDISLEISRADTDIAKAEAAFVQANEEMERNKRLSEKNAVSRSELESSVARMKSGQAELAAAKIARSQLDHQSGLQTVNSTIDGSVIVVYQQEGAFVQKGAPVVMVGDFDRLVLRGQIPDKKIQNISPLNESYSMWMDVSHLSEKALNIDFRSSFGETFVINAKIRDMTPPPADSAPLRNVTWELDNAIGLLEPGLYANITVSRNDSKRVLAVPAELIGNMERPALYVAGPDSRLAVREVSTGVYGGGLIEIKDGLQEGDVVITSGIDGLEPGTRIDVVVKELS